MRKLNYSLLKFYARRFREDSSWGESEKASEQPDASSITLN